MYTISRTLFEILEKNGIRDKSYIAKAELGNVYRLKGEAYDPNIHRKEFGVGKGKRRLVLFMNFAEIVVVEGSNYISDSNTSLNESQLRSIITYFKLRYARRKSVRDYCKGRIEMAGEYMINDKPFANPPFDSFYEHLFNTVLL